MLLSREMLVALGVGIILVTGAFYVGASDETIEGDITVVTKPPERVYIAPTDTDGDGISDWAEELLSDREAISEELDPVANYIPPSTLTEKFSVKFFQDYLYSKGFGEFGDSKEELAEQAVATLADSARDSIYTIDDVIIADGDSQGDFHKYGNDIAEITTKYSHTSKNNIGELEVLEQAMTAKNPARLVELDPIIDSYRDYLEQTLLTSVPPSLINQHVDLINVYSAILNDLLAMRQVFEDPLLALLRVKRYNDDVGGLIYVYYNMDLSLRRVGVSYDEDEPGILFESMGTLRKVLQQ